MSNEPNTPQVPYIVHEGEQARAARTITRLQILCGTMAAAFVLTNAAWILHFI